MSHNTAKNVDNFPARLRQLRLAAGLTQSELEDRAGLPRTAVSQIESGHRGASLRKAAEIAEALGVGVDELLQDGPKKISGG